MTKFEVYVITNMVNGKQYVGITTRGYKRRFIRHKAEARAGNPKPLYAAMRKHGVENFTAVIVDWATSWDQLCEMEQRYVGQLHTYVDEGCGYNLTRGGEGAPGRILSEDHKVKIQATKNTWTADEKDRIIQLQRESTKTYWDTAPADVLASRKHNMMIGRREYLNNRTDDEAREIATKIQSTLRKRPPKRKTCIIDGVEYFSISEASRALNVPVDTIRNRIRSINYPTYVEGTLYEHQC